MRARDKALLIFLVWLAVFPSVVLLTYAFRWIGLEAPLWLEIGVSTMLTVPMITMVALPFVERLVAASRDETPAELKMAEAREAPGPDPDWVR